MSVNLIKSRTVFFPDIPQDLGKQPSLYLHFTSLQDEMSKQVVGLFDNDAALRDALNTAVSVAVTAPGDMVVSTGTGWGVLPIGSTNHIMFVNGTQPGWAAPATINLLQISGATTGAVPYYNATTGWTSLPSGLEGQHLVYKTDSGHAVWTTDAGPTNAPTATDGKLLVSSGDAWTTLAPGASGQQLAMSGTMPAWIAAAAGGLGAIKIGTVTITSGTTDYVITGMTAMPKFILCCGGNQVGAATVFTYFGYDNGTSRSCVYSFTGAGAVIDDGVCAFLGGAAGTYAAITVTAMTATGFTFHMVSAGGTYLHTISLRYAALG